MAEVPAVQYAFNGDVRLAWMQWGSGPDVLIVPGLFSNIELEWEHEISRRSMEWMGRHCRVTLYDKRGMGLSDRFDEAPTASELVADVLTVMDIAGLEQPSLLGISEGGLICQLFAIKHPERVSKMVLANSNAGPAISDRPELRGYWAELISFINEACQNWGTDPEGILSRFAPDCLDNPGFVRWFGRFQRQAGTGADVSRHLRSTATVDAYDGLPQIVAPTLVATTELDQVLPPELGDLLAERIPSATRLCIDGGNHFFWFGDAWLDSCKPIVEFLIAAAIDSPTERRFGCVVFTDIVDSTRSLASHGDAKWSEILDQHDRAAWRLVDHYQGTLVKNTGDGILARFDVPSQALGFANSFKSELVADDVPIRVGIHAGEIELRHDGDITGVAVNIAARVEQAASDDTVFVSSTVRDMMLGGDTRFVDRGRHELKGIEGEWLLYELAAV